MATYNELQAIINIDQNKQNWECLLFGLSKRPETQGEQDKFNKIYKQFCLKYHPDKNCLLAEQATIAFQIIENAKDRLISSPNEVTQAIQEAFNEFASFITDKTLGKQPDEDLKKIYTRLKQFPGSYFESKYTKPYYYSIFEIAIEFGDLVFFQQLIENEKISVFNKHDLACLNPFEFCILRGKAEFLRAIEKHCPEGLNKACADSLKNLKGYYPEIFSYCIARLEQVNLYPNLGEEDNPFLIDTKLAKKQGEEKVAFIKRNYTGHPHLFRCLPLASQMDPETILDFFYRLQNTDRFLGYLIANLLPLEKLSPFFLLNLEEVIRKDVPSITKELLSKNFRARAYQGYYREAIAVTGNEGTLVPILGFNAVIGSFFIASLIFPHLFIPGATIAFGASLALFAAFALLAAVVHLLKYYEKTKIDKIVSKQGFFKPAEENGNRSQIVEQTDQSQTNPSFLD